MLWKWFTEMVYGFWFTRVARPMRFGLREDRFTGVGLRKPKPVNHSHKPFSQTKTRKPGHDNRFLSKLSFEAVKLYDNN